MLLRIGSKKRPAPPCSAFLPSPVMSHAKPPRGATFLSEGVLKIGPPGTVLAACRSSRTPRSRTSRRVAARSEEHTAELQSRPHLVCRLLLDKKKLTVLT